jgi:hypothetical protein
MTRLLAGLPVTSSLSGKLNASATTPDPVPKLALSSVSAHRCTSAVMAVVTQYVTQARRSYGSGGGPS